MVAAILLLGSALALLCADAASVKPMSSDFGYHLLYRSNDQPGDSPLPIGTLIDQHGKAIMSSSNLMEADVSFNPDFSSLQTSPGGHIFSLVQFESSSPAAFYVTKLSQDAKTGKLTPVISKPTNWSAPDLQGLWIPCAGSVTPWMTHAGGEEYEPDAYCVGIATSINGTEATSLRKCLGDESGIVEFMRFYGFYPSNITIQDIKAHFNPYLYGHAFEVTLKNDAGDVHIKKHFAMGRHSYELWYTMPDQKTVYSTDDGTNTGFWKFVADKAGDMSSGTLYGAKLSQISDVYGGDFAVSWINLGHGTQAELEKMIVADKITFADIFETAPWSVNTSCPEGFTSISKRDNGMGATCLKLKAGMEKAAAFLESRRYLAMLGGTVELSKFEGITFDPVTKKMYAAMSQIRYGMENNASKGKASTAYDEAGPNQIRLPYNPCGCIYAFDVTNEFNVTRMYGELCGQPLTTTTRFGVNRCDQRNIAEPDNVVTIGTQGTLIIGEDVNENQIDYMWQYDLFSKELIRIFASPYGAETTSPYWFPNTKGRFNGWSYLGAAIQHPYGESDQARAKDPEATGPEGYVGFWPMRASSFANGARLQFVGIPMSSTNISKHNVHAAAAAYTISSHAVVDTIVKGK